jgi:N6-L-threonylcarbamoyladenine synthase
MSQNLLAIESSCDETSAAVIRDGEVASLLISSQSEHREWGGVVPELASRAHLQTIGPMIATAIERAGITYEELNAVAVTTEPGLVGSLLVGVNAAKGISVALDIPLISVHHIEAHLLSVLIEYPDIEFPFLGLVVSGGHTLVYNVRAIGEYELIGATRDDAAGEAFDKGAKMLGLGYPGGPAIDKHAERGNPHKHQFPRGLINDASYDFSFSGLKTSLRYYLRDHYPDEKPSGLSLSDICASYQEAIVAVLVAKAIRAAKDLGYSTLVAVGGVSVNSRLRSSMNEACAKEQLLFRTVNPVYSTDNAAMIGIAGWHKLKRRAFAPLTVTARAAMIRAPRERGVGKKGKDNEAMNGEVAHTGTPSNEGT